MKFYSNENYKKQGHFRKIDELPSFFTVSIYIYTVL